MGNAVSEPEAPASQLAESASEPDDAVTKLEKPDTEPGEAVSETNDAVSSPSEPVSETDHAVTEPEERASDGPSRAGGPRLVGMAVRVGMVALGLVLVGYGVDGALGQPRLTHPWYAVRWLAGGIVLHDGLLAPATCAVGLLLSRLLRAPYRAVTQSAMIISGSVALASLPLWRGYTSDPGNTTVDPLPYGRNLAIVLGAVWFTAGTAMIVLFVTRRTRAAK